MRPKTTVAKGRSNDLSGKRLSGNVTFRESTVNRVEARLKF